MPLRLIWYKKMSGKHEQFVTSYLRLNGYFVVPNFIVHAGDDQKRILSGRIGNYTETDILGIRMPYSREQTGRLHIANDPQLVNVAKGKFDVVVAEVKSGRNNKPNSVWKRTKNAAPIEYIVRFIGLQRNDSEVKKAASSLLKCYEYEDDQCRIRYIMFSSEPNYYYQSRGVKYFTYGDLAKFLVEVRGQCWLDKDMGVASSHPQWDPLLNKIFDIANDLGISIEVRKNKVLELLNVSVCPTRRTSRRHRCRGTVA